MKNPDRPLRIIDQAGLFILLIFLTSALYSCEETCYDGKLNNNEEQIDCGGPCVVCDTTEGTCFDGILNQGEEDIDCGGPCNACISDTSVLNPMFICNGNGGSSYFPLSVNSYWIYEMMGGQWLQLEVTEVVTQNNGEDYFHVVTTGAFGTIHDYFREEAGQVYRWNNGLSQEEVYLPANPAQGQQWTTAATDSMVVGSITATLNSPNGCSYENLLQVRAYNGGTASTTLYKRGLGIVQLVEVQANLDSVVIF